ncbi:MAG TPA: dihydrofolate reductase family protein [Actinomycetota bacterium]|nr:dihydrofolate reductase family protein [Actinomycetota bacterium]
MRKLLVTTFLSLDGVMQAPGGPEEDPEDGFTHGGWTVPLWDGDLDRFMEETPPSPFDLLLGRRTYEIFARYWPDVPEEAGGKPLNEATKYVASRSRPSLDWGPAVLLDGDVAEEIGTLKETDGPGLLVYGSANLIQTLMRAGLIDEYALLVFPVTLGTGKRLFADGTPPSTLRLVDSRVSSSGVLMGTYAPAGELVTGSFATEAR